MNVDKFIFNAKSRGNKGAHTILDTAKRNIGRQNDLLLKFVFFLFNCIDDTAKVSKNKAILRGSQMQIPDI